MQTENPPQGEMRFLPVRAGRYRLVVMDLHNGYHEHAADTVQELNTWLLEQSENSVGAFLEPTGVEHVHDLLELHGAVHVRTGFDCDLVFIKGGAPRG